MANGHILATDLVRHASYQRELLELIHSLTEEGPDGNVRAALKRPLALDACIAFRRRRGLLVREDVDPLIYLVGIHRAAIRHPVLVRAAEKIPPDADAMRARGIINYSEHWLIRRGLGTDVDTEFNPKARKKMPWEVP